MAPRLLKITGVVQKIPLLGHREQKSGACLVRSTRMGAMLMLSSPPEMEGRQAAFKAGAVP